jgi:glycosyltransferase involved in cell wall biosynthesis
MVKISVIIPTLNEEKYLPQLLESLKKQIFRDFEVIVSDSYSKDNTAKIAKKYGAKVVLGPKLGPGYGRNLGAKKARGEILLFMDSDGVLDNKDSLKVLAEKMYDKNFIAGSFRYLPLEKATFSQRIAYYVTNWITRVSILTGKPFIPGFCFFFRKDVFEKVGGFNEELVFCEDHDLSQRVSKASKGKFIYINIPMKTSMRRLKGLGFWQTIKDYLIPTIYYLIYKKTPRSKFKLKTIR